LDCAINRARRSGQRPSRRIFAFLGSWDWRGCAHVNKQGTGNCYDATKGCGQCEQEVWLGNGPRESTRASCPAVLSRRSARQTENHLLLWTGSRTKGETATTSTYPATTCTTQCMLCMFYVVRCCVRSQLQQGDTGREMQLCQLVRHRSVRAHICVGSIVQATIKNRDVAWPLRTVATRIPHLHCPGTPFPDRI